MGRLSSPEGTNITECRCPMSLIGRDNHSKLAITDANQISATKKMKQYIHEKKNWSDDIMEQIPWTTLKRALGAKIKQQTHFMKLCNDNLSIHQSTSSMVPNVCTHATYTRNKRLPSSVQLNRSHCLAWGILADLQDQCKKFFTDPTLSNMLHTGFRQWIHGKEAPLNYNQYPLELFNVIILQNAIGWRQWIKGIPSVKWNEAQQRFWRNLSEGHPGKHHNTPLWTMDVA